MKTYRNTLLLLIYIYCSLTAGPAAALDLERMFDAASDLVAAGTGLSEKEEIQVGREIAGRTLGAAPLVNDAALQSYVNRVGRWLALQSERPDLPRHFGAIDTVSINAFAAPGGYVLITRGLYEILDNEAEFEADAVGVVVAARAGYSPYGLVEVLHKLAARGGGDAALALLFKTHPQPGERLSQLGDALTPRMARLPEGREPGIRTIAAEAGPVRAPMSPPAGAKALQEEPAPAARPAQKGIGVDPGQILRGIFGR